LKKKKNVQNYTLVLIEHDRMHEFVARKDTTRPNVELNPSS